MTSEFRDLTFNLMHDTDRIESIVKKDRIIVTSGIVAVALLAWGYMLYISPVSYTHLTLPTKA